jgi:hypothetical protein
MFKKSSEVCPKKRSSSEAAARLVEPTTLEMAPPLETAECILYIKWDAPSIPIGDIYQI